jgi:2-dehydro-3-deoxyphosphogluconate aldolase/(4S)-4-hydroxy-2-oxoglutarate aldolase
MTVQRKWKMDAGEVLGAGPVVPVIVIEELNHAVPLARALLAGGISVLEITLRTPIALDAIRLVAREVPEAMVGAGTVLTGEQLRAVEGAGGLFAISPGLTPSLLAAADGGGIPLIPGIATVSELMTGMERGYGHFKFFPAEAAGGAKTLKAISGVFPRAVFCPTGGVTPDNYRDYLMLDSVRCVGGSWLVPGEALRKNDWQRITGLAAEAVAGARM